MEDHCRALDLVLRDGRLGETYNIGTGEERSIEQIADAVLEILAKPPTLKRYVEDRPGPDRRYLLDHSKIRRELGWRPTISFEDGLRETIEWYGGHRDWWLPKKLGTTAVDEFSWSASR